MKKTVQLLASALLIAAVTAPALSFEITAGLSSALSDIVEAYRTRPNALRGADLAISTFDAPMIERFTEAWGRSANGSSPYESVVLILRMADGSYRGRVLAPTNEHLKFTFRWHPATIAIVHTHPNRSDPRPQDKDLMVADTFHVPIFTITSRGMYVYDPSTRIVSRVMVNLDWLDVSKWTSAALARQ